MGALPAEVFRVSLGLPPPLQPLLLRAREEAPEVDPPPLPVLLLLLLPLQPHLLGPA